MDIRKVTPVASFAAGAALAFAPLASADDLLSLYNRGRKRSSGNDCAAAPGTCRASSERTR
jgi:hypothetical protein